MFMIEKIFVDDKDLAKVLRALAGHVFDMGPPVPVNADRKGKRLLTKGGSAMELVLNWFTKEKIKSFDKSSIKDLFVDSGLAVNSVQHTLQELLKAKRIKRVSRGHYEIIPQKKVKRNG